jgi:RNA polymerase sigma factor (sigma-70 family)
MDPESSFELIVLAQSGDTAALDRLLARYRPRLQQWASGRLPRYARGMTDTEDLVQDALLGTVKNFERFENRGEWALQAYLRRAVTNRVRSELERVRSRPRQENFPEGIASPESSPLQEALGAEVFERYEAALSLTFLEGRTIADAARLLRLEQKPLYRRVDGLIRRLRSALEAEGIAGPVVLQFSAGDGRRTLGHTR